LNHKVVDLFFEGQSHQFIGLSATDNEPSGGMTWLQILKSLQRQCGDENSGPYIFNGQG